MKINELLELNKALKDEADFYYEKYREVSEKIVETNNKELDLKEIDRDYNYLEAKEVLKNINLGYDNRHKIEDFLKEKKEREYPEILGVKYYKEINQLDKDEEFKVTLDTLLKESCRLVRSRDKLEILLHENEDVANFLIKNKIIERLYAFKCNCDSWDCDDTIITEEKFNTMKAAWKDTENKYTWEDGYLEVGCWNDGWYEIDSEETLEEHYYYVKYKLIKEPDLTLDNL